MHTHTHTHTHKHTHTGSMFLCRLGTVADSAVGGIHSRPQPTGPFRIRKGEFIILECRAITMHKGGGGGHSGISPSEKFKKTLGGMPPDPPLEGMTPYATSFQFPSKIFCTKPGKHSQSNFDSLPPPPFSMPGSGGLLMVTCFSDFRSRWSSMSVRRDDGWVWVQLRTSTGRYGTFDWSWWSSDQSWVSGSWVTS